MINATFDELVGGETTLATLIADRLEALDIDEILETRSNLSGLCFLVQDVMNALNVPDELFNLVDSQVFGGCKGYSAEHFIWFNYPHFSGNILYPIPAPDDYQPARAEPADIKTRNLIRAETAYHDLDRWHGSYGAKRLNALDWLIEYLRINPHCFSLRD